MNDMTIGATIVVLLFRSLYGLHRLVHNGALVQQWPHDIRSDGGEERKNDNEQKHGSLSCGHYHHVQECSCSWCLLMSTILST